MCEPEVAVPIDVTNHPLIHNAFVERQEGLSPVERLCQRISPHKKSGIDEISSFLLASSQ